MTGSYDIVVKNSIVQFKFRVSRNITILRGDSATGKTTMVDMVRQHALEGDASGVSISTQKECTVLTGIRWQDEIRGIRDSIVFIDEGFSFVSSDEFARAIRDSDNYYVIATRDSLFNLPYSIKEIYRIRTVSRRSKYQEYDRIYSEFYPIYDDSVKYVRPDAVIVEDSNAAYDFFNALCQKEGIRCISAAGKTGIYSKIKETTDGVVLVIADGAAFGSEMERVMSLRRVRNTVLFLPESFEWLILRSGLIDGAEVQDILKSPYDYIESGRYFSWERFFTVLLTERTVDTHLQYSKRRLNPNYLNDREASAIRKVISDMTGGDGQT